MVYDTESIQEDIEWLSLEELNEKLQIPGEKVKFISN